MTLQSCRGGSGIEGEKQWKRRLGEAEGEENIKRAFDMGVGERHAGKYSLLLGETGASCNKNRTVQDCGQVSSPIETVVMPTSPHISPADTRCILNYLGYYIFVA